MTNRRRDLISIGVAAASIVALLLAAEPPLAPAAAKVERAAHLFTAEERTSADVQTGIDLVLEAATMASARSRLGPEVRSRLAEARERLAGGGEIGEPTVRLVHESYALLHGGAPFRMPPNLTSMQEINSYLAGRLRDARLLLEGGDADAAVPVLVEVLAAIFTPVEAHQG